jgi:hypothetical protein
MTERRFNEAEVAAIFERATEARETSQRELPSGEGGGLTLTELKEIGSEVVISPDMIVQAAQMDEVAGRLALVAKSQPSDDSQSERSNDSAR